MEALDSSGNNKQKIVRAAEAKKLDTSNMGTRDNSSNLLSVSRIDCGRLRIAIRAVSNICLCQVLEDAQVRENSSIREGTNGRSKT